MNTTEILQGIKDWSANRFARKDGFYESMGVGTAVNLAGQVERTNDSLYRTSGGTEDIATGTARIEHIKGQTIAWNQCLNVTNDSQSSKGITISCQDGVLSVSGAFDGTSPFVDLARVKFNCVNTHKYYIYIPNKLMSDFVLCNTGNNSSSYDYDNIKVIKTATVTKDTAYVLFRYQTTNVTLSGSTTINIFDLTLIYGVGNEPSTPEQFEADYQKWFGKPLTYEPYDEGSLKNVMLDGLKTIGFNQWDEEWEEGRIDLTTGDLIQSSSQIRSKNYIPIIGGKSYCASTPSNITFGIYVQYYDNNKNPIIISGANNYNYKNTVYQAPTNARYAKFYCSNGYGNTYNHDICINLSWSGVKDGTYEPYEENTISIPTTTMTGKLNGQGESVVIFPDGMNKFDSLYYVGRKTYGVNGGVTRAYQEGDVISKTMVTDGHAYTYVKRETPLVYEVDDFTLPARYKVNGWGTEKQLQASGAKGIAAIISCLYSVNAVDILRNLPKNYISTESMDNFLAALGAAMGGTWTKSWNDNDGEYNFSFTANSQPDNSLQSTNEGA